MELREKSSPLLVLRTPISVRGRPGLRPEKRECVMTTIHDTKAKRLIAALGIAAAAVTPALLFAGAGTAHADDPCYGDLAYSYYCSPGAGALNPEPVAPAQAPSLWTALPGCTGGVLAALDGEC